MLLLIVIDEAGDGVVMTTGEHAGGGLLFLDCTRGLAWSFFSSRQYLVMIIRGRGGLAFLGVGRLLVGVGSVTAL